MVAETPATIDERVVLACAALAGDGVPQDYETAVYWLSQVADESVDAAELLRDLQAKGLGIERAVDDGNDPLAELTEMAGFDTTATLPALQPNWERCVNCGSVGLLVSNEASAGVVCDPTRGGCGEVQRLPIYEPGLTAGLALTPYTEPRGAHSFFGTQINLLKYTTTINDNQKQLIVDEVAARIRECAIVESLVEPADRPQLVVIPAPFSKTRRFQPVNKLAQAIARMYGIFDTPLIKHSTVESKNRNSGAELAENEITCRRSFRAGSVLLIDDTYGEGATVRACVRALQTVGVEIIYFLALCKNLFGGIKDA